MQTTKYSNCKKCQAALIAQSERTTGLCLKHQKSGKGKNG